MAKEAVNVRLWKAPAAEALVWLAPRRRFLTPTESAVVDVITSWTFGGGPKWKPLDRISLRQFATGVGLSWGQGTARSIERAINGLLRKDIVRRITGGPKRMSWFRLAVVDEILERTHAHHDNDPDREAADDVLNTLQEFETVSSPEATVVRQGVASGRSVSNGQGHLLAARTRSVSNGHGELLSSREATSHVRLSTSLKTSCDPPLSRRLTADALKSKERETTTTGDSKVGFCGRHGRHLVCDFCRQGFQIIGAGAAQ
jgi:hypothetical protein